MNKGLTKIIFAVFLFFLSIPLQSTPPPETSDTQEVAAFFENANTQEIKISKNSNNSTTHIPSHKRKRSFLEKKTLSWIVWCAVKGEYYIQSITSLKNKILTWIWHEARNT